jgi:hypothetical protein
MSSFVGMAPGQGWARLADTFRLCDNDAQK